MEIKRFNNFNINENLGENRKLDDVYGLGDSGRKAHGGLNRKIQYFYDYYTGKRISGIPKYELNNKMFKLAERKDDIGIIAQFCLQLEREGILHDYDLADLINKKLGGS